MRLKERRGPPVGPRQPEWQDLARSPATVGRVSGAGGGRETLPLLVATGLNRSQRGKNGIFQDTTTPPSLKTPFPLITNPRRRHLTSRFVANEGLIPEKRLRGSPPPFDGRTRGGATTPIRHWTLRLNAKSRQWLRESAFAPRAITPPTPPYYAPVCQRERGANCRAFHAVECQLPSKRRARRFKPHIQLLPLT